MYHQRRKVSQRSFVQKLSWATMGFFIACDSNTSQTAALVRVGTMYLLTGGFATYGEFARDGIILAKDEINQARGINGKPLEVIFECVLAYQVERREQEHFPQWFCFQKDNPSTGDGGLYYGFPCQDYDSGIIKVGIDWCLREYRTKTMKNFNRVQIN